MLIPRTPRLYKHKRTYSLVFYDPRTQKRKWLSLGTGDKAAAERRAKPIIQAYERQEFNPFVDSWMTGTRISEARERYERKQRGLLADKTITHTAYVVERLERVMPAGATMQMVTAEDMARVILSPPSAGGRHNYRRVLSAFWTWATEEGIASGNPARAVKLPKRVRRAPRFLSHAEAVHLMASTSDETADLVRFAIGSGLRGGELVTLRFADVDVARGVISVRGEMTKGKADRIVPLSAWSRQAIESRRAAVRGAKPFPYDRESASKKVKYAMQKAGIGKYSLHTLRHTFASWLRIGGAPLDRIQYWLGHRSISTTMVYAHIEPDAIKNELHEAFSGAIVGPLLEEQKITPP